MRCKHCTYRVSSAPPPACHRVAPRGEMYRDGVHFVGHQTPKTSCSRVNIGRGVYTRSDEIACSLSPVYGEMSGCFSGVFSDG